jgi:16S rRNA A1518/A1519 N6-dimethyltransferase RsmA/KsgA/DIM1 with predicted DNA glycosylase/AP lyase activity
MLHKKYPKMTAIEIDQRAVAFLGEKIPGLNVVNMDVLECDWPTMAKERGGPLSIIGNLPFYITSQILFSLADSHKAISKAVVTMQYEVESLQFIQVVYF